MFMNGALAVLSFPGVLWAISPFLFGFAVGYAALGTLATIYLGRPLIGLDYRLWTRALLQVFPAGRLKAGHGHFPPLSRDKKRPFQRIPIDGKG
jgi:hypothetical protein